jgi:8-amino-7-oxononanoate synthase
MPPTVTDFEQQLLGQLNAIREQNLLRQLRRVESAQGPLVQVGGRKLLNFSSNDYLGLADHPALKEAARRAVERFGAGSGASRLLCGSLAVHHELEEKLAAFKGTQAALAFSCGYSAAIGALGALLGKDDVLIIDKLVHASIVDGARLCGAKLRVFAHNDLNELESVLKWAADRKGRKVIATESVFSMDGDLAPLREIIELKERYGAWLLLDEAHATGLFGQNRRGLVEAFELGDRVEISMGTLGKALGSAGGFICGSRALVDVLVNRARSFIFSTAPPPAQSAAASAAIDLVQSQEGEDRRAQLWARVDQLKNGLISSQWKTPILKSAIVPLIVGEETRTVRMSTVLRDAGLLLPAIRYPTVALGEARLRLTVTASHTPEDLATVIHHLTHLTI